MRIDYFVVAEKLKDRIVSCEMHGQGIELQGMCWILLLLGFYSFVIPGTSTLFTHWLHPSP